MLHSGSGVSLSLVLARIIGWGMSGRGSLKTYDHLVYRFGLCITQRNRWDSIMIPNTKCSYRTRFRFKKATIFRFKNYIIHWVLWACSNFRYILKCQFVSSNWQWQLICLNCQTISWGCPKSTEAQSKAKRNVRDDKYPVELEKF